VEICGKKLQKFSLHTEASKLPKRFNVGLTSYTEKENRTKRTEKETPHKHLKTFIPTVFRVN